MRYLKTASVTFFILAFSQSNIFGLPKSSRKLKTLAVDYVEADAKMIQQMVDMIFSFGELGFQEIETSRYLVNILKKNGFKVQEGISGMPTAWMAEWGSGKPVIALGSDIDGIPKASQKPGVGYHDPIIEGAPGHGEGHNSGQAVIVAAALAVKKIMKKAILHILGNNIKPIFILEKDINSYLKQLSMTTTRSTQLS